MSNLTFSLAVIFYLALLVVLPVARLRARHGVWAVVFSREADPVQRLVGAATGLLLVACGVLALIHGVWGPQALGVWALPGWVAGLGWAMLATGALADIVAQVHMGASFRIGIDDRPTALITGGLFRLVRNPIFSGLLLALLGVVLIAPCAWTVMGYITAVLMVGIQVRLEEQHLLRLHGDGYARYANRVGRFVPGVGLLECMTVPEQGDGFAVKNRP